MISAGRFLLVVADGGWPDGRLDVARAGGADLGAAAVIVRPDGYVARATDAALDPVTHADAIGRWVGAAPGWVPPDRRVRPIDVTMRPHT